LAALACTLLPALRIAHEPVAAESTPRVWVALSAAALAPMAAAIGALRGARKTLRSLEGPDRQRRGWSRFGFALWLASLVVAFSLFGSVLRATTHQRALAGVTFAFGALAMAAGLAAVCARLVAVLRTDSLRTRVWLASAAVVSALASLALVGVRSLRAASHDAASRTTVATALDLLGFVAAALLASSPRLVHRRAPALVGLPVAVVLALFGLGLLRHPVLRSAIEERAPAYLPLVELLSRD
jgi:hypothetical protein